MAEYKRILMVSGYVVYQITIDAALERYTTRAVDYHKSTTLEDAVDYVNRYSDLDVVVMEWEFSPSLTDAHVRDCGRDLLLAIEKAKCDPKIVICTMEDIQKDPDVVRVADGVVPVTPHNTMETRLHRILGG